MSLAVTIDTTGLDARIHQIKGGLAKAIRRANSRTAGKAKTEISKTVRSRIAVTSKGVNQTLEKKKKGTGYIVTLKKSSRPSLKEFSARQTKAGVSYRIDKDGKRKVAKSAFIVQKLGGHAFKRKTKARFPLSQRLRGASAWGAFTGGHTREDASNAVEYDLSEFHRKRLEHEVAYEISKAT